MKNILISVIIPVYNSEKYLETCLRSIQEQTFPNYEVWLIDDGSTDHSSSICDDFVHTNPNFYVIHKKNNGVSAARNTGLKYANGEWICFVDSDDTIEKNYLVQLYNAISTNPNDTLVIQGFKRIESNKKIITRTFNNQIYTARNFHLVFEKLNINRSGYPFGKLYNNKIIQQHQIRFIENIHYAEDVMFMLTYMCHISKIQTIDGATYNYYIHKNNHSLSHRIFSFESEYYCYETYLSLIQRLQQKFNIPQSALINVYDVISEYLVRRSIGSMYQSSTYKPRSERIHILKSITPSQINFLNVYYKHCSWFHKVTTFLLTKHYYYLCDMFNCIIAIGRILKH